MQGYPSRAYKRVLKAAAVLLLCLMVFPHTISADQGTSVYDALHSGKGVSADQQKDAGNTNVSNEADFSLFPFLLKLLFSFLFILLLIYLLLRFLAGKTKLRHVTGPFRMLGAYTLAANRSLQAVKIGQTVYILGVGQDVRVIGVIPEGEEQDLILNQAETEAAVSTPFDLSRWIRRGTDSREVEDVEEKWNEIFLKELGERERSKE